MWPKEWEPLKVRHQPTKFDSDKHRISADIMVLVSHVISQDHVIQGWELLTLSHHLTKFDSDRNCISADIMVFVI